MMASTSKAASKATVIPDPPLYVSLPSLTPSRKEKRKAAVTESKKTPADDEKSEELKSLRQKKAWEVAIGPAKSVPMQGFMMYMSGSTIQMFSGMAVIMLVKNAISGALNVNNVFTPFEDPKSVTTAGPKSSDATEGDPYALLSQKVAYVVCQGLLLCVAIYKVHTMGLLPTHSSDWLAFVEPNRPVEFSSVGIVL